MREVATTEYEGLSAGEAFDLAESSDEGLTGLDARARLGAIGPNAVEEKRPSAVLAFLGRYWGPMPWLLEFAMVLTLAVGHVTEAVIIFALLTLNAVVGQVQAGNSRRAVELLQQRLQVEVLALRDGSWKDVDARGLVPGDVVDLRLGELVPADAYVLAGGASVDASSLTGESLPRRVEAAGVVFSGSIVAEGSLRCLVVNTGGRTYFGRTVSLVQDARPASRQQKLLFDIVQYMMYVGVAASVLVTAYALLRGADIVSVLSLVTTFLMGAIPVALPAVLTIVQAVAALGLSRRGVLVTRLDSIEDAASVDVFCFDKTGTITENRLAVADVWPVGMSKNDLVRAAALSADPAGADAIDSALAREAEKRGVPLDGCERIAYLPFDPARKRTDALAELEGARVLLVKGAPATIVELAAKTTSEAVREQALDAVRSYSERGFRSIALARACTAGADCLTAPTEGAPWAGAAPDATFELLGIVALADPPRADSAEMIARMQRMGCRCLMLTGDDVAIAREVAREVGIEGEVVRACEFAALDPDAKLEAVEHLGGVAEVYPEDKHRIVSLLQKAGHMVGMTGDGVNDAPALKQAELGCAVDGATDVARAAASAVLMRPGLSEILDALVASRETFERMLTWVVNKVTKVLEVVVLFTLGYVWTGDMLVSLLGMSLLVFANDFATMSIATDNVTAAGSPSAWRLPPIVAAAGVLGVLFALEDLLVAWVGMHAFGLDMPALQTLVMYALVVNSQVRILMVRERRGMWASVPSMTMRVVAAVTVVAFTAVCTTGLLVPAVPMGAAAVAFAVCIAGSGVLDAAKRLLFRRFGVA